MEKLNFFNSLPMGIKSKDIPPEMKRYMDGTESPKALTNISEADLQTEIADLLNSYRIAYSLNRISEPSTTTPGWPDFTFCYRGVAVAFECKVGINKLSESQEYIMQVMQSNGWLYCVIRSSGEASKILKTIEYFED